MSDETVQIADCVCVSSHGAAKCRIVIVTNSKRSIYQYNTIQSRSGHGDQSMTNKTARDHRNSQHKILLSLLLSTACQKCQTIGKSRHSPRGETKYKYTNNIHAGSLVTLSGSVQPPVDCNCYIWLSGFCFFVS